MREIKKPFGVLVIWVLCILIGFTCITQIPLNTSTKSNLNTLKFTTFLKGSGPLEIERDITSVLESNLSRIPGVIKIESNSSQGYSQIIIRIDKNQSIDHFKLQANSIIKQIHEKLPKGSSYPIMEFMNSKSSVNLPPLLSYSMIFEGDSDEYENSFHENLLNDFHKIKGIEKIEFKNLDVEPDIIRLDRRKLLENQLSPNEVYDQLQSIFEIKKVGHYTSSVNEIEIEIKGEEYDLNDFFILNKFQDKIPFGELITSKLFDNEKRSFEKINGLNTIQIDFYAKNNSNQIRVTQEIKKTIRTINQKLEKGRFILQSDGSQLIKENILNYGVRLFISFLLTTFLTFKLFKNKNLGIVLGLLIMGVFSHSFLIFYLMQIPINTYSLMSIGIGIGIFIDHCLFLLLRKKPYSKLLFSTFTISILMYLLIFSILQKFEMERGFADFTKGLIAILCISIPLIYIILPSLLHYFPIKNSEQDLQKLVNKPYLLKNWVNTILTYRSAIYISIVFIFGLPFFIIPSSHGSTFNQWSGGLLYKVWKKDKESQLFQHHLSDENSLLLSLNLPEGSYFHYMQEVVFEFENLLNEKKHLIQHYTTTCFRESDCQIQVVFHKNTPHTAALKLQKDIQNIGSQIGSLDFTIQGYGPGFSNIINLREFNSSIAITGYNYQQLERLATQALEYLNKNSRVNSTFLSSRPYKGAEINQDYVILMNNVQNTDIELIREEILNEIENQNESSLELYSTNQPIASIINQNDPPLTSWRLLNTSLGNLKIPYKISSFSDFKTIEKENQITRINQEYVLFINYKYLGTPMNHDAFQESTRLEISKKLPEGFGILNPPFQQIDASHEPLNPVKTLCIILAGIFIISIYSTENLIQSVQIIFIILFSFLGVFIVYLCTETTFHKGFQYGLIGLSGIISTQTLYFLNLSHNLKNTSLTDWNRFFICIQQHLPPYLISCALTIISLSPFILFQKSQSFTYGFSLSLIGGLISSFIGMFILQPLLMLKKEGNKNRERRNYA